MAFVLSVLVALGVEMVAMAMGADYFVTVGLGLAILALGWFLNDW